MNYSVDVERAYGGVVGKGLIRQVAEDFYVDEVLGFEPSGSGEHAYLLIRKIGANTGWVAEEIARFLGLRYFDVGYAGKKDRHAVTEQWFSCWLPGKPDPDWSGLTIDGVEILKSVRHDKKLRRGVHVANRFRLKVKHLELLDPANTGPLESRLHEIADSGFPNYFGPQRFGFNAQNLVQADVLFAGGKVARRKRDIYISAVRSYIFNRELSLQVKAGTWMEQESNWLFGLSPHRDIEIPGIADEFSTWAEGLTSLGVKAMSRDVRVIPEDLCWEITDDLLELSFTLPTGAYATSLLHELIDYEEKRVG